MKTLYFIRHGQSLANTGAKSLPDFEIPLTELGQTQAKTLLANWQNMDLNPTHIYHSQMLRAKQTAQVFADNFNLPLQELDLLNEFRCLSFATVADMVGEQRAEVAKNFWQTADISHRDGEDSDSFEQFLARVNGIIQQADDFDDNSLFFCHGIWIGLLAWRLLGCEVKNNADMQRFRQFQTALPMDNTVVYQLKIENGVKQLTWFKVV